MVALLTFGSRRKGAFVASFKRQSPVFVLALEAFSESLCDSRAPTLPSALIHFSLCEGSLAANHLNKGWNLEPHKSRSFLFFRLLLFFALVVSTWQEVWRKRGTTPPSALPRCCTLALSHLYETTSSRKPQIQHDYLSCCTIRCAFICIQAEGRSSVTKKKRKKISHSRWEQ